MGERQLQVVLGVLCSSARGRESGELQRRERARGRFGAYDVPWVLLSHPGTASSTGVNDPVGWAPAGDGPSSSTISGNNVGDIAYTVLSVPSNRNVLTVMSAPGGNLEGPRAKSITTPPLPPAPAPAPNPSLHIFSVGYRSKFTMHRRKQSVSNVLGPWCNHP